VSEMKGIKSVSRTRTSYALRSTWASVTCDSDNYRVKGMASCSRLFFTLDHLCQIRSM